MEEQSIALSCDDYYLSLIATASEESDDDNALMSDSKYAEELQFQDVLISSLTSNSVNHSESSGTNVSKDVLISSSITANSVDHSESSGENVSKEVGEPSQHLCEICADKKDNNQMFAVHNCGHRYCNECITKHISIMLQKSKTQNSICFMCPGLDCKGVLELHTCRKIMPDHVVAMWEDALCESMIIASQRFYCPFKDCSGMIVNDSEDAIRESECPFCHRLFCAQCRVPWHSGFDCKDFSKLNANERAREDLMLHELAKTKKWQRCPRCKFFVEKVEGCLHMTCRCRYEFCYSCGATWTSTHGGCQPRPQ